MRKRTTKVKKRVEVQPGTAFSKGELPACGIAIEIHVEKWNMDYINTVRNLVLKCKCVYMCNM